MEFDSPTETKHLKNGTYLNRCTMRVPNKTHYPTDTTRMFNDIPDPMSFVAQSCKRQSYFQRIYFEHQYTKKLGGQTFFYTFTYNNAALPYFEVDGKRFPCFCYDDIRKITNGSLSKFLLRHYGSQLVYFCAPESGSGKGSRGYGNNPHYHFLFFIRPFIDSKGNILVSGYKPIPAEALNRFLKKLWLGSDAKFVNYKSAKFGIVKPGENLGLVDDSQRCFSYVGKYVTKDSQSIQEYKSIEYALLDSVRKHGIDNHVIYNYYCFLRDTYNDGYSKFNFWDDFCLGIYQKFKRSKNISLEYFCTHPELFGIPYSVKENWSLVQVYFEKYYQSAYVDDQLRIYRNLYSGKCRMSKSLGLYGLQFIQETPDGTFLKIPSLDGYKIQKPSLYYLRKLYYDIFKCPVTGNVLYRLNKRGLNRSCELLPKLLDNVVSNTISNIASVFSNQLVILTDERQFDDDNKPISYKFSETSVFKRLSKLPKDDSIYFKYAVYSMIYKNRYYSYRFPVSLNSSFSLKCITEDFRNFSDNNLELADYMEFNRHYFDRDGYKNFKFHPLFASLIPIFELFDIVNEFVSDRFSELKTFKFESGLYRKKRICASQY